MLTGDRLSMNTFLRAWGHPIHRAGLQSAISRSVAYLLPSPRSRGPIAIPYINDSWLFCDRRSKDVPLLRLLILKDFTAMSFIAHFLRATDHFVDVGAGIGSYSVLAAVTSGARVSAIEPAAEESALLSCSVVFNRLQPQVKVLRLGVTEISGRGVIRPTSSSLSKRLIVDPCVDTQSSVPVHRLDEVLGNDGAQVLKVAAAGDELEVLRGAHDILARSSLYAVLVSNPTRRDDARSRCHRIDALLERHGFVAADYDPIERQLLKPGSARGKQLFVRKCQAEAIMRRLRQASHFHLTTALRI